MEDSPRSSDIKIGIFVIVAIVIFSGAALWIAGSSVLHGGQVHYRILMKDARGMEAGDEVRCAGVEAGRIKSIEFRPGEEWPVLFQVTLDREIPVRIDATARITADGILGASFLQVDPGTPSSLPLPPGGEIHGVESLGVGEALAKLDEISGEGSILIQEVAKLLSEISGRVGPLLARFESLLSEENTEHIHSILQDVDGTLEESRPRLVEFLVRLESLSGKLDDGMENLPLLVGQATALIESIQTSLGPEGSRLTKMMDTAETGISSAGGLLSTLGDNRVEIEATLRDLRESAANLKEITQTLKERPFSLVRIKPKRERRPGDGVEDKP